MQKPPCHSFGLALVILTWSHDFLTLVVGTTPSKAYGKKSWLMLSLSPATTAGIVEEKQPAGTLTVNRLQWSVTSQENSKEELRCT